MPAQISDGVATVTITDDDAVLPSYYSVADTQTYEGEGLYVQISRTGNVNLAHNLSLSWTNGTAFQGFDFTPPTATVSFLAGESSKLIAIQTIEDTLVEPDEAFSITLSSSDTTALFTDDTATLTILNDDAAPVTITNITKGIVFTPFLAATHNKRIAFFEVSEAASEPVGRVAEGGDIADLNALLDDSNVVYDTESTKGLLEPGQSV